MNEIQAFDSPVFGTIRIIEDNGTILFCGVDVAKALGYARPGKAIIDHCKGVLKRDILTNGGEQEMSVIPESDLYRLAFSSKLPAAEKFTDWVTEEVLPSIRKHGLYMTPAKLQETLAKPENLFVILQTLAEEQEKNAELTEANQKLEETNLLLASGEHQWSGKALLNALVRSYAKNCCGGNNPYAWTYYYKQLKYKHGIDVSIRKAKSKDKNIKKIDLIRDNEMNVAVKLAASICEQSGLDVPHIINLVNAGDIYPCEAS